MSNQTKDQILEILAQSSELAKAAPKGPWVKDELGECLFVGNRSSQSTGLWEIVHTSPDLADFTESAIATHNNICDFIAAARTDLPARDEALRVAVDAFAECVNVGKAADSSEVSSCEHDIAKRALSHILAILKAEGAK